MYKEIEMKPFNIEEAKRGKPVQTRDGRAVRILCFDKVGLQTNIVALVMHSDGCEDVACYKEDGSTADILKSELSLAKELLMAPYLEVGLHVDDFVDFGTTYKNPPPGEKDARWFLFLKRLPANLQAEFDDRIKDLKLFCDYAGSRYRCTGASRMGDVWLTSNLKQDMGYEKRVDVEECSNWGTVL